MQRESNPSQRAPFSPSSLPSTRSTCPFLVSSDFPPRSSSAACVPLSHQPALPLPSRRFPQAVAQDPRTVGSLTLRIKIIDLFTAERENKTTQPYPKPLKNRSERHVFRNLGLPGERGGGRWSNGLASLLAGNNSDQIPWLIPAYENRILTNNFSHFLQQSGCDQ